METIWNRAKGFVSAAMGQPELRKRALFILAVFFILQLYFVRELIAAELLFGTGFAVLLALGGVVYALGTLGERGLDWAESGVRVIAPSARRFYCAVEELSRKAFRHLRSESAQ